MRYFYSFLFYLTLPYLFLRLWWRSRRLPAYRKRLTERLGFYPFALKKCIWVHSVSVGETLAAVPLIKQLKIAYPDLPILMTTMTPTGALQVKTTFNDSVHHAYIPYDFPGAVKRFLGNFHPVVCIIMETELWPNLLHACHKNSIPVCLTNARLSAKSARGYRSIASLTREIMRNITVVAAHGQVDADRFIALGMPKERTLVTGNLKFDLELPLGISQNSEVLRNQLGKDRFVWIAGSTHEGEEPIILNAHQQLRKRYPQALLILVPRHPDRFETVAKLCANTFVTQRRSQQINCADTTAVYLADTMGELMLLYAIADVAFVGGSLIPRGGHNMLEPGALGKAIITGPHLFNFAEISHFFIAANALTTVTDAKTLAVELIRLVEDPIERVQRGVRAQQVVDNNRGAVAKQFAVIKTLINY